MNTFNDNPGQNLLTRGDFNSFHSNRTSNDVGNLIRDYAGFSYAPSTFKPLETNNAMF